MNWLEQLNLALDYIEDHLEDEIDGEQLSQIACCSSFHFQRLFSYMAGVPLAEYIRRRKMTKAAFDLQNTSEKIVSIGLKYGYESPTAFNRAFQSIHGVAPSAARNTGVNLKAYSPICFKITIRGVEEMNYRIEEKDGFRIMGVKMQSKWSTENQEGFQNVPAFWNSQQQAGTIPEICQLMNSEPMGLLGVTVGDWQNTGFFDYYIAVASTCPVPEGYSYYDVPPYTWAIFECKGAMPTAIQNLQKRIMTEWLPNSGYHYANAPDIEVYTSGDQQAEDYVCWVWVPVEK